MSTYWYFQCDGHEPPLQSDDEFTQHTGDAAFRRGIELAQQRPVAADDGRYWGLAWSTPDDVKVSTYFEMNARKFLHRHPSCSLSLVNEYGEHRALPQES